MSIDPTVRNFLSTVARCNFRAQGRGALFFDPEEKKTTWVPMEELAPDIAKQLTLYVPYVIVRSQDELLHVIQVHESSPDPDKILPTVTLLTVTDQPVSHVTEWSVAALDYPKELLDWKVCEHSQLNDVIDRSSSDMFFHVENGEYYFPDSLRQVVHAIAGQKCAGCCSCLIYDPVRDEMKFNFEDDLGVEAMKRGTLLYTRAFWEERPWGPEHEVALFIQGRGSQCSLLSPVDVMCFVEKEVGYLQDIANWLPKETRSTIQRLYQLDRPLSVSTTNLEQNSS